MTDAPALSPYQHDMIHHLLTHRHGIITKLTMGLGVSFAIASALGQTFEDGEEPNVLAIVPAQLTQYWRNTFDMFDVPADKVTYVTPQKIVKGFEFTHHLTGRHQWIVDFNCLTSPRVVQLTLPALKLTHNMWGEVMYHPGHRGWEFASNYAWSKAFHAKSNTSPDHSVMFPVSWQGHADALKA